MRKETALAELESVHDLTPEEQKFLLDKYRLVHFDKDRKDVWGFEGEMLDWLRGEDNGKNSAVLRNADRTPAELACLTCLGTPEKAQQFFGLVNKILLTFNPDADLYRYVEDGNPETIVYRCDNLDRRAFCFGLSFEENLNALLEIPEFSSMGYHNQGLEFQLADAERPLRKLKDELHPERLESLDFIPCASEIHIVRTELPDYQGTRINLANCDPLRELTYALEAYCYSSHGYKRDKAILRNWHVRDEQEMLYFRHFANLKKNNR